jgi:hypothetical protein
MYAASVDTEGDPLVSTRHRNQTIGLTFLGRSTTDALLQAEIYGGAAKVDEPSLPPAAHESGAICPIAASNLCKVARNGRP